MRTPWTSLVPPTQVILTLQAAPSVVIETAESLPNENVKRETEQRATA
jgi:hypothetical protein